MIKQNHSECVFRCACNYVCTYLCVCIYVCACDMVCTVALSRMQHGQVIVDVILVQANLYFVGLIMYCTLKHVSFAVVYFHVLCCHNFMFVSRV